MDPETPHPLVRASRSLLTLPPETHFEVYSDVSYTPFRLDPEAPHTFSYAFVILADGGRLVGPIVRRRRMARLKPEGFPHAEAYASFKAVQSINGGVRPANDHLTIWTDCRYFVHGPCVRQVDSANDPWHLLCHHAAREDQAEMRLALATQRLTLASKGRR